MLTSLAPSPTAKVVPHFLTIFVIYALVFGETLQQTTLTESFNI
jgi:hypothetical protein